MTYYVGDSPAQDLVVEPMRGEEPMDLSHFDSCSVTLHDEAGVEVPTAGFFASIDEDSIIIEWPGGDLFEVAGMYSLRLVLENAGGARERLAPVYIVAQGDDGWLTLDGAREGWADAEALPDRLLYTLLAVAKRDVLKFAPPIIEGALPPIEYVKAQGDQARNKLNAAKVDPASGGLGDDSFVVKPFPLDWTIRQTLRPKRGVPVIA